MKRIYLCLFFALSLSFVASAQKVMPLEKKSQQQKVINTKPETNVVKTTQSKTIVNEPKVLKHQFVKPVVITEVKKISFEDNLYELREVEYYLTSDEKHPSKNREELVRFHEKKVSTLLSTINKENFSNLNNEDKTSTLGILKIHDEKSYPVYFSIYKEQY
jgi:hypothetical protein